MSEHSVPLAQQQLIAHEQSDVPAFYSGLQQQETPTRKLVPFSEQRIPSGVGVTRGEASTAFSDVGGAVSFASKIESKDHQWKPAPVIGREVNVLASGGVSGSTSLDQRSFAVGGFRPTILHDEENAPIPMTQAP